MQAHYLPNNVQKLGKKIQRSHVTTLEFYKHAYLKLLTSETEHVFALSFTDGHRTQAMEQLRYACIVWLLTL